MTQPTSLAAYVDLCERRIITVRELEVVRTLALLPAATCSRCVWEAMKVHSITRHPIPQHSVNPRFATLARNGIVLAQSYSAYTLELTPSRISSLDATIDELATIVDIQPRDRKRFKRLLEESRSVDSLPIRTKLSDDEVARFMAQRFRFPGVDVRARLFRNYPLGETGAHILQGALFVIGVAIMIAFVRAAQRVEPFTRA